MKHPQQPGDMNNKDEKLQKLVKADKQQIEELLKSAMQDYLKYQTSMRVEKTKNINNLVNLISEYLGAFIVLGYDVTGNPVNLIHATSQMDADALATALNKLVFSTLNNSREE